MTPCPSDNEIWKDIPEYEGIYQASTLGRIRTVEGKTTFSKRHGVRTWKSRVLKGRGNNPTTGKRVSLWKNGKMKDALVARLVAMTFLGKPAEGYTVNHIDGNRFNNRIENLEWLSLGDNIRHGFRTGLYKSTQKAVRVEVAGVEYDFASLSEFSRFLGKSNGYVSNNLKRGLPIYDQSGNPCKIVSKAKSA
jgi:hypothetical protein